MEVKKSASASLENKSHDFLLMGLIVALGFLFIIFEWTTTDMEKMKIEEENFIAEEEEMMEVTVQKDVPPPPPPPVQAPPPPVVAPSITTVSNDQKDDDVQFKSSEDDGSEVDQTPVSSNEPEVVEEEEVFVRVEVQPSFPGGPKKMMEYLQKNLKYPASCQEAGIQGRVIVSFVVEKDGKISKVEVIRPVNEKLDAEAVRVVQSMPSWTPGEQQGKKVRSKFQLPVVFRIQG